MFVAAQLSSEDQLVGSRLLKTTKEIQFPSKLSKNNYSLSNFEHFFTVYNHHNNMNDTKVELSEQEADLYDRQIRLWGLESQKRLRAADVLLIGVRSLGAEIAKNILLSGIRSLTFLDDGKVSEQDLLTNFLLPKDTLNKHIAEAVLERARNLNPMVQISSVPGSVEDKDETFFKGFSMIIATRLSSEHLITINQYCRQNGTQFICGDVFGLFGYTFSDLQEHQYYEDVKKFAPIKRKMGGPEKAEPTIVRTMNTATYVPLQDALGSDWTSEDQKKTNQLSPQYYLMRVLLSFRDTYKRDVNYDEKDSDVKKLKEIRDKLFKLLEVDSNKLPNSYFDLIFDEVVPVCAIVGGILSQEVIKAISHNEPPANNFFFFDPENLSGRIECVAI